MKVFVIGSHGMLGRYVTLHLKKFYPVVELNREDFDVAKVDYISLLEILMHSGIESGEDVIINCAGKIKSVMGGDLDAIMINSVFPHVLANVAEHFGAKLIHPSTDCVYDGLKGGYDENDAHNAIDVYGKTKSLGEPKNCCVIRTSIIGEEVNQGRSLVEWVKKNHDSEIPGYTNHIWNGVTCYQFAKICHEMIEKNYFWNGVRHIFSNSLTKCELVNLISTIYNLNIMVKPKDTPVKCDRSLTSIYEPLFIVPTLGVQIAELREVERELYGNKIST